MSPGESNGLVISGPSGPSAVGKPFPLFGSPAVPGARFILGAAALQGVPLHAVRVCLEWDALPPDFDERYKAYGLRRNDFQVRLERIQDGAGTAPDSAENLFPLFPVHGNRTVVELPSRIKPYWGKPVNAPGEGFLCLRLVAPAKGFGNADYPQLVAAAALENASRLARGDASSLVALPSPPFLPIVRELELWLEGKRVGP